MSMVFFSLNNALEIQTLWGGLIRVPSSLPLIETRALSQTRPRSSNHPSASSRGLSKVIVYLAVPENFLTASPPKSVHEPSSRVSTSDGSSGPPSTNFTDHVPAILFASPFVLKYPYTGPLTRPSNV